MTVTQEMIEAGQTALSDHTDKYMDGSEVVQGGAVEAIYVAMSALAPTAPVEASGSELADAVAHTKENRDRAHPNHKTMFVNVADLDLILSALRPQPSGETREDAEVLAMLDDYADRHIGATRGEDMSLEEMLISKARERLSARPLALGGQQGDSETLRVLLDNLVIAQTMSKDIRQKATDEARSYLYDLRHTPARAEAQDEGAAGEPVAKVVRKGFSTGSISWTKFGQDADLSDETPLYAHPSPTPAADADRVRNYDTSDMKGWVTDTINRYAREFEGARFSYEVTERLVHIFERTIRETNVLAALKSTAAKEGGEG